MGLFKKAGVMAMALTMAMSLVACGDKVTISADNENAEEIPQETKTYRIATNISSPPFEFKNILGDYVGVDVDLLNAIAEKEGFTYELVPMPFIEVFEALDKNEVDGAIAGIFITEERKEKYDFSEPYLGSDRVLAANQSRRDINGYEDLAGKTVAVTRGTIAEKLAESMKDKYDFTVESFDNFTDAYKSVLSGNSQAIFEDSIVIRFLISQGYELKVISDVGEKNFYGFAVPKGKNPELLKMFNQGLEELKQSEEYEQILDNYIQG